MSNQIYWNAKYLLIDQAKEAKRTSGKDKPYVRQVINDSLNSINQQIDWHEMKEDISLAKSEQYKKWLESLACNLHPKY